MTALRKVSSAADDTLGKALSTLATIVAELVAGNGDNFPATICRWRHSPKTATVAEFCDGDSPENGDYSRRKRRLSPNSATATINGEYGIVASVDRA